MNPEDKQRLSVIQPFHVNQYDNYALTSLLSYCALCLQEWQIRESKENLTVAAFKMFPTKFSMIDWPEYPDKERVNRTLLQMRPKYRNLATSITNEGVYLNSNGLREARALLSKLGEPSSLSVNSKETSLEDSKPERGDRPRTIHSEDILIKLKNSRLFQMFKSGRFNEAEAIHLIGMLGVYDHTPSAEKRRKLKQLIDSARDLSDQECLEFLSQVKNRFSAYLDK